MAAPHLLATAERNNDGFIAQSIRIRRDRAREGGRERGVSRSPCEESVISQAKCEWLTRMSEGGESRPRGDGGVVCWRRELPVCKYRFHLFT